MERSTFGLRFRTKLILAAFRDRTRAGSLKDIRCRAKAGNKPLRCASHIYQRAISFSEAVDLRDPDTTGIQRGV